MFGLSGVFHPNLFLFSCISRSGAAALLLQVLDGNYRDVQVCSHVLDLFTVAALHPCEIGLLEMSVRDISAICHTGLASGLRCQT